MSFPQRWKCLYTEWNALSPALKVENSGHGTKFIHQLAFLRKRKKKAQELTSGTDETSLHLSPVCGSINTVNLGGRGQAIGVCARTNESRFARIVSCAGNSAPVPLSPPIPEVEGGFALLAELGGEGIFGTGTVGLPKSIE